MKLPILLTVLAASLLVACTEATGEEVTNETSPSTSSMQGDSSIGLETHPAFLSSIRWDTINDEGDYYILNYAGTPSEEEAVALVDSLIPSFPNAGYLWIPDFASLSGKELFAVFLDQNKYKYGIMESLQAHKTDMEGIYVVNVSQDSERWVAYSPIDIRINGEKAKMILTYATPEEEEAYFNDGGEDWMWFVSDVQTYFNENHPEILFESVYYCDLLPEEIEQLEQELDLEGFCYIFTDGKNKAVMGHDLSDFVIAEACEFYGFEAPDYGH